MTGDQPAPAPAAKPVPEADPPRRGGRGRLSVRGGRVRGLGRRKSGSPAEPVGIALAAAPAPPSGAVATASDGAGGRPGTPTRSDEGAASRPTRDATVRPDVAARTAAAAPRQQARRSAMISAERAGDLVSQAVPTPEGPAPAVRIVKRQRPLRAR